VYGKEGVVMLLDVIRWAASAVVVVASAHTLAAEPGCTASVCADATWPAMVVAAPAFDLDQHFGTEVIADMVNSHAATDEPVAEHEETVHLHQYASLDEVMARTSEP
jgi:signal recognition particle receptor subunit beta